MSTPEPTEPGPRSIVAGIQVILETADTEVSVAAMVAALEAEIILPAVLDVDGVPVTVIGAHTEVALEMAVPPAATEGAYGR